MARGLRRAVFAALAAAMLGGVCVLTAQFGTRAHAASEEAEEEQDQERSPTADPQPKGGKKRQDPAEAQRAIEAALKQVQAGRADQAVQAVTATLSAGNLPPALMAKALYVRGLAYRRQGRSAQAISDLNSALWLKGGLGGEDRVEASKERSAAYADAGLGGREPDATPAAKTGGTWLSGLFGSSTPASEPPAPAREPSPPAPPRAEPAAPAKSRQAAVASGWSSRTEVKSAAASAAPSAPPPPPRAAAAAPPPQPAPPPAPAEPPPAARIEGRYLVQLASVRTESEARALAAKAKREPALARRQSAIDHAVLGNMGAFYRVRFGPFASAQETEAVCAKLQGSGFDCLPVGP
jgi:cell division septation protein DedD